MKIFTTCIAVLSLALAGCSESETAPADNSSGGAKNNTIPAWLLASAPADARGIADAKADAEEGQTIVIRGIIGGHKNALTSDSAVFRIIDVGLDNPCVTAGDDHCPTPWDYCCTPPEDIKANSATVQLVSANGAAIDTDLLDAGLEPLDEVIIVGVVAPRPDPMVLTIKATGVYKQQG